jgi:predicted esterase
MNPYVRTFICVLIATLLALTLSSATGQPSRSQDASLSREAQAEIEASRQRIRPVFEVEEDEGLAFIPATTLMPVHIRLPDSMDESPRDLVVALHGFGGSAENFVDLAGQFVRKGMIFAAPEAPAHFQNNRRKLAYDWDVAHNKPASREKVIAHASATVLYLVQVIESLKAQYPVRNVYTLGFSQGGVYATIVGVRHPHLVDGIVSIGMGVDKTWFGAESLAAGSSVPILLAHSPRDQVVEFSFSQESSRWLESNGYDVTLMRYNAGHHVPPDLVKAIIEWLEALEQ